MSKLAATKITAVSFSDDNGELWVEVEGDSVSAVRSPEAKSCAIKAAAAEGYQRCGFNQDSGPFVVDEHGNAVEADDDEQRITKESALLKSNKAKYRNRIRVMQGLGA
jgi:hypothetical protein